MEIKTKRIYEPAADSDGFRILVDRLWPRGMKKEAAHIDLWLKEVAPSAELRKWFNHEPEKFEQFVEKYHAELKRAAAFEELATLAKEHKILTLLFGAKDEQHNQAVVLKQFLAGYGSSV
jgi:DNA-3-methyladenine glycosylase